MTDQSIMNKIMALLAQAESTTFEEEAASYWAKAQELMIKHSVDESQLTPEERESIVTLTISIGSNRPDHILWNAICLNSDVRFIRIQNGKLSRASLVGFPLDIEYVQVVFASLMMQRESFLARAVKPWSEHGRSFNHSFRMGFANRVFARLKEAKEATMDQTPGTALVLADKNKQVEKFYQREYPRTIKQAISSSSAQGYRAGGEAANRADMSGGRNTLGSNQRRLTN